MNEWLEHSEMPTSGQFVAVWQFGGKAWADTYRWINGILWQYEESTDDFTLVKLSGHLAWADVSTNPKFFTS